MRYKNYLISFLLLLSALTATAQTCPGPAVRTALINLQKSNIVNGTRWGQIGMTDTCGNQRYVTLDSITQVIVDSIQADTTLQRNWYTHNGVTTDLGRVAFVKRTAWWRTLDSLGFFRFTNRPDNFNGSQFTIYQDSITLDADTIIWKSSWHPELQVHEMQADGTYWHLDSTKVGAWGQFPGFPSLAGDGRDKGFFYNPINEGVKIVNGDALTGFSTFINAAPNSTNMFVSGASESSESRCFADGLESSYYSAITSNLGENEVFEIFSSEDDNYFEMYKNALDTNVYAGILFGDKQNHTRRQFEIYTIPGSIYSWIQLLIPNDTTENALSFYNRAYYWRNEHPTGTANTDTLLHFWAATGPNFEAGKDPGFMTLDQIRGSGVNWYNSNGTTTDNTRIADVLETATWRSDNVVQDGIVPFRFELSGGGANEPENMVWVFPSGDSAVISQADQEIILFTNTNWLFKSDGTANVQADSFAFTNNFGDAFFKVGRYGAITQGPGSAIYRLENEYAAITGTGQTELFLDGSSAALIVGTGQTLNFRISLRARCTDAGNGVGITTGESFGGWYYGAIKRIGGTTSLVGTVQTPATAQSDAGMSTSVVTVDADDTAESLRIRFTPPSTAGSTTTIGVTATIEITQ